MSTSTQSPNFNFQTILVTGGCGFIASNFINYMGRTYPKLKIINVDKIDTVSDETFIDKDLREDPERYLLIRANICNTHLLQKTLLEHGVECVLHFAAQSHVDRSFTDPVGTIEDNIIGTVSVLEACRLVGSKQIKRIIHVSTDEVYGDSDHGVDVIKKTENDDIAPTNPYSASKAGAEHMVRAYKMSYNLPIIITRSNNAYGPRQNEEKVIPRFISLLRKGQPVTFHGSGKQLRSWIHVDDVCHAFDLIMHRGTAEKYNIATTFEASVKTVAQKLFTLIHGPNAGELPAVYIQDRPYNDLRYWVDSSRLEQELGWKARVTFDGGLKQTLDWYLERYPTVEDKVEHTGERVLVFGHKGWIGNQFMEMFKDKKGVQVVGAKSRPGDDPDRVVEEELERVSPTHVIAFIGRTHGPSGEKGTANTTIDFLEGGPDRLRLNVRDNLYGPMLLALLCKKMNIHLTYTGTGCIFKYDDKHPITDANEVTNPKDLSKPRFQESDEPNFFDSSYSVVKGFTDRLMHHMEQNVLNVRIRMPVSYDQHPRNFITKIVNYEKVVNIPNSVTVLPQLLPVMWRLMREKRTGTINMVNPGPISHNQVLEQYVKYVDPKKEIKNFTVEEQAQILKAGRSNCCLDTTYLESIAPEVLPAHEAVRVACEEMGKLAKK